MSSFVLLSKVNPSLKIFSCICARVYVCHMCAGASKGQERVSDSLKLELQMVVVRVSANTRAF